MRNHSQIVAGIALAGLLALPAPGAAAPPSPTSSAPWTSPTATARVEVEIRATRAPSYTVFKLQDPPRLVVDVSGGDVSGVASPVRVDRGGVASVSTAQYQDEKTSVGRVVIALDAAARYEVAPQGETVRVKVLPGVAAPRVPRPAAGRRPWPVAPAPVATPWPRRRSPSEPVPAAPGRRPPRADDNVVAPAHRRDRSDEVPATAVTGVKVEGDRLVVQTNGAVGTFEVIELRNPPRVAIDLPGVQKAPRKAAAGRRGLHPGPLRPRRRQGARGARRRRTTSPACR